MSSPVRAIAGFASGLAAILAAWFAGSANGEAAARERYLKQSLKHIEQAAASDAALAAVNMRAAASAALGIGAVDANAARVTQETRNAKVPMAVCQPVVHRMVIPVGAPAGSSDVASVGAQPLAAQASAAPDPAQTDQPTAQAAGIDQRVLLTADAVRLWDSALVGGEQPFAGCTGADPSSPACAAAADIDLIAALANHTENSRLCAIDRIKLNELIDALERIKAAGKVLAGQQSKAEAAR